MRVKRGKNKKRKHKKYLKSAKGYRSSNSRQYRSAKNQLKKSMQYATRDRKAKKRTMRRIWISRINSACKANGISYSKFISSLKEKNVFLDRKAMQDIILKDPEAFADIIKFVKD